MVSDGASKIKTEWESKLGLDLTEDWWEGALGRMNSCTVKPITHVLVLSKALNIRMQPCPRSAVFGVGAAPPSTDITAFTMLLAWRYSDPVNVLLHHPFPPG